jgi:hypothetical protein
MGGAEAIQEKEEQVQMIRKRIERSARSVEGFFRCTSCDHNYEGNDGYLCLVLEGLHDVYLISMWEFRSMILCM